MAQRAYSFFALLLIFNILFVTNWQAVAGRNFAKNSDNDDKKEPQFLFKHDHGKLHFPSIGHFGFPPYSGLTPNNPVNGGTGGSGSLGSGSSSGSGSESGSTGHSYVPGGDDTSIPNPGVEVPIPGSGGVGGGRATPAAHP
ncbi:putative cell wall protein [Vicia villosa]|uniref:putative cell wall protein n=1 Tax=Vicia villosa TaxID=3911 RepID=UPI00273AF326|nr:putative cell wall protein [Vicia villosa]